MVSERQAERSKLFVCDECGLAYADMTVAEKCEAWCKLHHSCNLVLMKKAVRI